MPTIEEQLNPEDHPQSPQTLERAETAALVWGNYVEKKSERDLEQPLFRGRTLKNYLDDNVKRFVQYKQRPQHKRNWQSNLASTTPNEKIIGILSKLAMQSMEAKAQTKQELNNVEFFKEKLANYMLKHAGIKNEDDFQIVLEMMEASEKGTVLGFEDWAYGTVMRRETTSINPETGEMEYTEKEDRLWNDVRSRLVPLEDFVPGDIFVRPGCIQDMDDCYFRILMSKDQFESEYGEYTDADLVKTVAEMLVDDSTPFWKSNVDVKDDQIEVVFYFNKLIDEYIILANQVWINPKGKDTVAPLPWNHKLLPFWGAVFEPLDTGFFYGRSMIDKLIADCDYSDALLDRILDQTTLSVSRPILTDGQTASAMTKGFLQPNNVITTDWSQGRPKMDVVPIPEPSSSSVALYQLLKQRNEQSSMASEVIGGTTQQQKTATQIEIEQQGAMQIVSLFLKLMEKGIRDKNTLRLSNQIQFYSMPLKDGAFKRIQLRDTKMSTGETGAVQISIVDKIVEQEEKETLERMENIMVEPKALREMNMDIVIVPQSSIKMTEVQRQIFEINYQRIMHEMYPDKFDRDYGFDQLNRKFGKDPTQARSQSPETDQFGLPVTGQASGQPQPQGQGQAPAMREQRTVNQMSTI